MITDHSISPGIPKTIYQCVARKESLREEYVANIEKMKALNPDHVFTLFDDADIPDFIQSAFGTAYVDRFDAISADYGAAKADFFRYLLIYQLGGVYLDIKSTMEQPLDAVLRTDDRFILSQWNNRDPASPFYKWGLFRDLAHIPGGEYQQWHVIAAARHPYLEAVIRLMLERIDRYTPWRSGFGHSGVVRMTGPVMYTQAIHPIRDRFPHRLIADERALSLRYSVLSGKHDHRQGHHYVTSFRPIMELHGINMVAGNSYLAARQAINSVVKQPLRRLLRRPD